MKESLGITELIGQLEDGVAVKVMQQATTSMSLEAKAKFVQWAARLTVVGGLEKEDWIDRIPELTKKGLVLYRDRGVRPGSFLRAFLENDLYIVLRTADPQNIKVLNEIRWWMCRFMPKEAWGGGFSFSMWVDTGGIEGWPKEKRDSWKIKLENELRKVGRESEV